MFMNKTHLTIQSILHRVTTQLITSLQWRHNERDRVSNHQPHDCLLNRLFRCRSKKTSKLRVTGLCTGNSPVTGEFLAQIASYAENVSIWWRHHVKSNPLIYYININNFSLVPRSARASDEFFDLYGNCSIVLNYDKRFGSAVNVNYQSLGFEL